MKALFIALTLLGCQETEPEPPPPIVIPEPPPLDPRVSNQIDPEFAGYVQEWESLHPDNKPVTTPMSFAEIPEVGVLGVCITWSKAGEILREIRIDRENYNDQKSKDSVGAHTIIFHELGHCELDRGHSTLLTEVNGETIPYSIMFFQLYGRAGIYKEQEAHYIDELFGGIGLLEPTGSAIKEADAIMVMDKYGYHGVGILD